MQNTIGSDANVSMNPAVAKCFDALLTAISAAEDDCRMRAAEAVLDGDDGNIQKHLHMIRHVQDVAREVGAVYQKWKDGFPVHQVDPSPPHDGRPPRRTGTGFRVYLNGEVIEYPTAAETFARTIDRIGIMRVKQLNKVLSRIPLIMTSRAAGYQNQFQIGDFYICTHSSNMKKKVLLKEISDQLQVPLRVELGSGR